MDYLTLTPPDHDDCGLVDPNFTEVMENQLTDNEEEEDDDTGAQLESALGRRWTNNDSQRVVWRMDREIHALGPEYFAHYRAHFVDMVADPDFGHVWERAICRYINYLRAQGSLVPDTDTDYLVSDIWSEVGRYIDTGAVDVTIDTGAIDDDHIVVGSGVSEEALSRGLKRKRGSGEMCVVCQDSLGDGEQVAGLGCGHDYHVDCIKQWLREKNVCPLCKVRAVQEEDDDA
ncbi:RING/U-box superfamily protein [Striga hermonthica]|uniref:RING-type E3 ubiquitin transferase n=1 Tax=Striga hermonthica TaxID=68872 RepID=A0A9N7MP04_STRHE|nr:RING/U-box superfamily protein [Striga hermonthica]